MNKWIPILLLSAVTAMALIACSKPAEPAGDPLDGTAWTLFSYRKTSPIPGTEITLSFENGQISGSGGCNSYGAAYAVNGSEIEVSQTYMTEMACMNPEGVMGQESTYLQALDSAQTFELADGRLIIRYTEQETLTFEAQ